MPRLLLRWFANAVALFVVVALLGAACGGYGGSNDKPHSGTTTTGY